jgi:peptidoglycan/LPS O-acetylase OafA/YrhL
VSERRDALLPLTSLRFVAALLVFSWHCVPTRRVSATFSLGYIGVAFFFLLSGFILTYRYHDTFRERLRPEALRAFYAARVARVYPLHLATMPIAIAVLVYLGTDSSWSGVDPSTRLQAVAAQALLVQSWIASVPIDFGVNGPAWSISVEAFFYALFPFIAFGLLRAFRTATPRVVLLAAVALWLAQAVLLWPQHAVVDDWRWYVFPPSRLVDFVVGMLLGIAFLRFRERESRSGGELLHPSSVEALALAGLFLAVLVSPFVPLSVRFSAWVMPAWCAVILVFAARRGALSRLLSHPVLVRLGEISFAFYLCHLAVVKLVDQRFGWERPFSLAVAFGGTLALSFVLYHCVEEPMRGRVRALLAPRARGAIVISAVTPATISAVTGAR